MLPIQLFLRYADNRVFTAVGGCTVAWFSLKLILSVWRGFKSYVLSRPLGLATDLKKLGAWAVVTGSTDGIGKAYAKELAAKGINVVLISRSLDKLKNVAHEIESEYRVQTKVVDVDFTGGTEIYPRISKSLQGLEIGTLVNNVGMGYSFPKFFLEIPKAEEFFPNILNVNILSCMMMTKIVLPNMLERGKGAIINIASASGMQPAPLINIYAATKVFMDFFSRGLQVEYGSKGIIIQSVLPFFVTTKLSKFRKTSLFVPNPTQYVRSALATVGLEQRTNGCMSHSIKGWAVERAPEWLKNKAQLQVANNVRKYYLKKYANKKKE
ncbi:very-long-chain 3-oxoacyl-CoA reductase-B-like [Saccoglossus kowalevskii]|uniref:Estradiol 17-beta-dehydrogenase 12-B-like n=1 Tax=Saccoglossus kowalevskii TaxID=10224 RepID=A0ABM0M4H2_SACKO|nr:PREDICTED: estradiol 17-beta-dehydrogenase 12-B-like [Saccoglossus kowalevskii]